MKTGIIFLLIAVFITMAYVINIYLQKLIKPRQSLFRLIVFFVLVFILVFVITFFMVYFITKFYPAELIK